MKIVKTALVSLAAFIALAYALGYDYLFKGIRETYLRGTTGSSIDDGTYFPTHKIARGKVQPWQKDAAYNRTVLPKALVEELTETKTAALVVIKDGQLLHEQYWNGYNAQSLTNSFSMAKAVTVALVGKAIEQKKIKSWDEPFFTFFESYKNVPFGKSLTLRHLAEMEAGLDWSENYKNPFLPNAKAYYGKSLEEAVLLRGFLTEPGTKFEYQSGATQMLGFALRKSLNQTIASYTSETLWQPLGMENDATWNTDEFGMEKTFCCINSTARDFAKIGQLFLNEGSLGGEQILSQKTVEEMRTPTKLSSGAYGMGLWINNDAAIKHYYFRGLYGQYIIVVPEKNMVIVRTGMNVNEQMDGKGRPKQVELLVNAISEMF